MGLMSMQNERGEAAENAGDQRGDRISEAYHRGGGEALGQKTRDRINWICAQARGDTVLDIGCRQGIVSLLVAREGAHVTGLDKSPAAIEFALSERRKEIPQVQQRVEFRCEELASFAGGQYDTVIMGEALEHQTNPGKFIQQGASFVAPGGRIVIAVPYGLNPWPGHKATLFPRHLYEALAEGFVLHTVEVTDGYVRVVADRAVEQQPIEEVAELLLRTTEKGALDVQVEYLSKGEEESAPQRKAARLAKSRIEALEQEKRLLQDEKAAHERELASINRRSHELQLASDEAAARIRGMRAELVEAQQKRSGHWAKYEAERRGTEILSDLARRLHEENFRYEHSIALAIGRAVLGLTSVAGILGFPRAMVRVAKMYQRRRVGETPYEPLDIRSVLKPAIQPGGVPARSASNPPKAVVPPTENIEKKKLSVIGWEQANRNSKISAMTVLDEFSRACFAPHANLVEPRPDNWEGLADKFSPRLLLAESAWRGNYGSWRYRLASSEASPGDEFSQMLESFRKKGVPTVFWNKEDPVHFDAFVESAGKCDYVLTTSVESIPRYEQKTSAKVEVMQFAAEESLHNPQGSSHRNGRVCFSGSYYADGFPERKHDLAMLLGAAKSFELDIFDRNYGNSGARGEFAFPAEYIPNVRGRLGFEEMSQKYREYSVFLNVNSVSDSATMFSRRVFELLACGTPVISTYSRGIEETFGTDLVWQVRNQAEAADALRVLTSDANEWRRRSLLGIRSVLSKHSFRRRFNQILSLVGEQAERPREILVIAEVMNQEEVDRVVTAYALQDSIPDCHKSLLMICRKGFHSSLQMEGIRTLADTRKPLAEIIGQECQAGRYDVAAVFSPTAVYGRNYLLDGLIALRYSQAYVVGKTVDRAEYVWGRALHPQSLILDATALAASQVSIVDLLGKGGKVAQSFVTKTYAADSANFSVVGNGKRRESLQRKIEI